MLTNSEIRQLGIKDLAEEINKISRDLTRIRMDIINGSSKANDKIKKIKKQVARLETFHTACKHKMVKTKSDKAN